MLSRDITPRSISFLSKSTYQLVHVGRTLNGIVELSCMSPESGIVFKIGEINFSDTMKLYYRTSMQKSKRLSDIRYSCVVWMILCDPLIHLSPMAGFSQNDLFILFCSHFRAISLQSSPPCLRNQTVSPSLPPLLIYPGIRGELPPPLVDPRGEGCFRLFTFLFVTLFPHDRNVYLRAIFFSYLLASHFQQ